MKRALPALTIVFALLVTILVYRWISRPKQSSGDTASKQRPHASKAGTIPALPSHSVTSLEISSEKENEELISRIGDFTNLEVLKIRCLEDLSTFPEDIGKLTRLKELDMDEGNGCAMNPVLPESIGNLQALEKLNLAGAQDSRDVTDGKKGPRERLRHHFPAGISRLKELTYLNLGRNEFEEIPAFVKDLPKLNELDFSWNELKDIPAFIPDLHELAVLGLEGNDLADLPDSLNKMRKLREISVGNNCKITQSPAKRKELQRRFPRITFNFDDEYDCANESAEKAGDKK